MKVSNLAVSLVIGLTFSVAVNAANIDVLTAWYGQSCGAAHSNATSHVKAKCDGKVTCQYLVDVAALGDPKQFCEKNYIVQYACSGRTEVKMSQLGAEANGKVITLSCKK